MSTGCIRRLLLHVVGAALALAVWTTAGAETFPATPFNGLQVTYSFSGATAEGAPSDGGPFEGWVRTYKGVLSGGTLRISGSVTKQCSKGYGADASARVWAGSESQSKPMRLDTQATSGSEVVTQAYDLSVKIPANATSGGFSVTVSGEYRNGEVRFVTVQGSFTATAAPAPALEPPKPAPPKPDSETGPPPEDAILFVERVEGGDAVRVARGADPNAAPPDAAFRQASTTRKLWLRPGDAIQTGPGTEVLLRTRMGAVVRVKGNTTFAVREPTAQGASFKEFYGRLWKGMCNFYSPPDAALERRFGVEGSRAITSIRGTKFDVTEDGDTTRIDVQEGVVHVEHKTIPAEVDVHAGESVIAGPRGLDLRGGVANVLTAPSPSPAPTLAPTGPPRPQAGGVSVYVDGVLQNYDPPAMFKGGKVYVPLRAGAESLGLAVGWDAKTSTAEVKSATRSVFIASYEGIIVGSSLFLPLRRMGEATGAQIEWDGANKIVRITRPQAGGDAAPIAPTPAPAPASSVAVPRSWIHPNMATAQLQILFDNGNGGGVSGGPGEATRFTLSRPTRILRIATYHWGGGGGARPGRISLISADRKSFGPWAAFGPTDTTGPSMYWFCNPDVVLPAGTYSIIDSDPATWAYNADSGNAGMAQVVGHPEP